jgi:hypothetical protein
MAKANHKCELSELANWETPRQWRRMRGADVSHNISGKTLRRMKSSNRDVLQFNIPHLRRETPRGGLCGKFISQIESPCATARDILTLDTKKMISPLRKCVEQDAIAEDMAERRQGLLGSLIFSSCPVLFGRSEAESSGYR